MSHEAVIFLDIDGVLRRRSAPLYRLEEPLRRRFEALLEAVPAAAVVIASSWREAFSLEEIRDHFSAALRERIVGATPIAGSRDGAYREREVRAWLKRHAASGVRWVAIDDDPELYGEAAPLVRVDPERGLDDRGAEEVRRRLSLRADVRPPFEGEAV